MGPALLNNPNIPFRNPSLNDLTFFGNPATGLGGKNTFQKLLELISGNLSTPVFQYEDTATMLANTTIPINYFALVNDASGDPVVVSGWALYVYNGGSRNNLSSYTLLLKEISVPVVTVDTTGPIITMDLMNQDERYFSGSDIITTIKTWAFSNSGNGRKITVFSEYDGSYEQTFDPSVIIPGQYRVPGFPNKWLSYPGKFKFKADFDGVNWWMEIHGDY